MKHHHRWILKRRSRGASGLPAVQYVCTGCPKRKLVLLPGWAR